MQKDFWLFKIISLFFILGLITSCGGGLGGGSNLTISATSMEITAAFNDPTPTSPVITLSIDSGTVYLDSSSTANGIYGHGLYCDNSKSCPLEVQPRPPSSLSVGTYVDTINIAGCHDPACSSPFKTFTVTVTYNVTEGGTFTTSTNAIDIETVENISPAVESVDLSYAGGIASGWSASIEYIDENGWLSLSSASGSTTETSSIGITAGNLPVGQYSAVVHITSNQGTVNTSIPISYTVIEKRTSPEQLNYSIDLGATTSDIQQSLTVLSNFAGSNSSADWIISSDVDWISFSDTSGDTVTGNQTTVAIDPQKFGVLRNGTHKATLTLTSSTNGVETWTVPVTLSLNLPQVNFISPYTIQPATSGQIIIRGQGFSGMTSQQVSIGPNVATGVNIISDTEMIIDHNALAENTYQVDIDNPFGVPMSRASLHVLPATNYAAASIATSGSNKERAFYDHIRQSIYVADTSFAELERFHFNGTNWESDSLSFTSVNDIAMLPDASQVIVGELNKLYHVDLDTFTVVHETTLPDSVFRMAMTNDGYLILGAQSNLGGYYRYNTLDYSFEFINDLSPYSLANPAVVASGDGYKVILAGGGGAQLSEIHRYDASTGQLSTTGITDSFYLADTDFTGSKIIFDKDEVYDSNLNLLGTLSAAYGSGISADGSVAYVYNFTAKAIRRFDLNSPDGSGGFNTIGSDIAVTGSPGTIKRIIETPGAGNLIIAGSSATIIVPLP